MAKATELATTHTHTALSTDITDIIGDMGGLGFENISPDEISIPQVRILQSTSPAVNEGKGRPGDIYNTMTDENFGKQVEFIPLYFFGSRVKFVDSTRLDSGIDCQSRDGLKGNKYGTCADCDFSAWHGDEGPICIDYKNVMAIPLTEGQNIVDTAPAVISGKRKAIAPFKRFLTMASAIRVGGRQVPFFTSSYTMESQQIKNEKGTFYIPSFKRVNFLSDRNIVLYCKSQYEAMKAVQSQLNLHQADLVDEPTPPEAEF